MPRRNRGRDRRRQRPTPGYTWQGNKLVPITSTNATTPAEPKKETPSWSDFGPDSLAPGETEVPSFEAEVEQHQETQQAAAIQERESSILTGGVGGSPEKKYSWIDDDRIPSQAEIDFYAAQESGEGGEITQAHLDEIGQGEGGEGHLAGDMVKTEEEIAEDNAPENQPAEDDPNFTSEHNSYIDPETGEKKNQTRQEWSASIGDDAISVGPTDTTPNELAGGSLMAEGISGTSGKSSSSSVGGGYGKSRKREISRGQMNLTKGRNRSILTS